MLEDDISQVLTGGLDSSTSTSSNDWPTVAGDRVYPLIAPQGAPLPRVTFQRVTTRPINTIDYPSRASLDLVRVQVDAWAASPEKAMQLARQIRLLMQAGSFKGTAQNQFSAYDSTAGVYRESQDFHCWEQV